LKQTESSQTSASIESVRQYWNQHVDDWKIARHPSGTADFFSETEQYRFEKLHYLSRQIPFQDYAGKEILEVGCGLGNDLARFAAGGALVTGIDLAERAVELAQTNFQQRGLRGDFHRMNGEQMELDADRFDLVYCHTVLQFTPEPSRMVAEIHRVLKPGGQAILMAINSRSWLILMHRLLKTEIDYLDAPVFRCFSAANLRQLLSSFEQVMIIPERFPVRTRVHKGLKARLYNVLFVDLFNALPHSWVRWSGHHLLAYAMK
jgi:2-polyprenyl-3-methyl-5-hydroxy-6-metoxy-1,4-benzoquinol methylase